MRPRMMRDLSLAVFLLFMTTAAVGCGGGSSGTDGGGTGGGGAGGGAAGNLGGAADRPGPAARANRARDRQRRDGHATDYNHGTGFFVLGSKLYDANGVEFRIRGVNKDHWDYKALGLASSKANTVRWNIDFTQPAASNVSLLRGGAGMTAGTIFNHMVVMPSASEAPAGTLTCSEDATILHRRFRSGSRRPRPGGSWRSTPSSTSPTNGALRTAQSGATTIRRRSPSCVRRASTRRCQSPLVGAARTTRIS